MQVLVKVNVDSNKMSAKFPGRFLTNDTKVGCRAGLKGRSKYNASQVFRKLPLDLKKMVNCKLVKTVI